MQLRGRCMGFEGAIPEVGTWEPWRVLIHGKEDSGYFCPDGIT